MRGEQVSLAGQWGRWVDRSVGRGQGVSGQGVRDASPTQMYSFLPASWVGDTHEETDVLPIGDREEKDEQLPKPSY